MTPTAPPPIPAEILRELAPEEHLLWAGRPPQGLDLRLDDGIEAIVLVGGELLQFVFAVGLGGPAVAVVNGLLTAATGTRVFHRLWTVPRRRRRMWYGLTADHLLVVVVGPRAEVCSVRLADVAQVEIAEWKDGSGIVRIHGPDARAADLATLELVADARAVYDLIRASCHRTGRTVLPPGARHSP